MADAKIKTGIGAGASFVIYGPTNLTDGFRLYGLVGGNNASGFRVQIEISTDGGATWHPLRSFASAAGNGATYVQQAEVDVFLAGFFQVTVVNLAAGAQDIIYDMRTFPVRMF